MTNEEFDKRAKGNFEKWETLFREKSEFVTPKMKAQYETMKALFESWQKLARLLIKACEMPPEEGPTETPPEIGH